MLRVHRPFTAAEQRSLVQFATQVKRSFSSSLFLREQAAETSEPVETTLKTAKVFDAGSIHHLHDEGIIKKPIHAALVKLGYHKLTGVQEKSIMPVLTTDADFITKAKTGTGKTLAFGIPLIEESLRLGHGRDQGVVGVVIAPTRDLAFQIKEELNKIVRYKEMVQHTNNMLHVQTLVGGESRSRQLQAFSSRAPCPSIIVATPGRLMDMLKEPSVAKAFEGVRAVVLDEADRLLGEGFKEDLVEITDVLKENLKHEAPFKTMLYSATWDKDVQQFSKRILRPKFEFIDTVDPNAADTHEKIEQSLILTNDIFESYVSATLFIEKEARASSKHFKAVVFLPTIKSVSYFYELLATRMKFQKIRTPVHQLHGQLQQGARDRAVRDFKKNFSGVLVCSDVGARGMDFPNVTNVIQIGLPMDATNYVHRVGRTARGGKDGAAVMILSRPETKFLRVLSARNINVTSQFEYQKDAEAEAEIADVAQQARHKYSLDLVVESLAGFSKGIASTYRLNMLDVLQDYSEAYGKFSQDESKKPHVSPGFATRVLSLNRRDASKLFDLGAGSHEEFTERENKGGRGGQGRGSFNRGDRDGGYQRRDNFRGDREGGYQRRDNFRGDREGGYQKFGGNRDGDFSKRRSFDRNDGFKNNDRRDSSRGKMNYGTRGGSSRGGHKERFD